MHCAAECADVPGWSRWGNSRSQTWLFDCTQRKTVNATQNLKPRDSIPHMPTAPCHMLLYAVKFFGKGIVCKFSSGRFSNPQLLIVQKAARLSGDQLITLTAKEIWFLERKKTWGCFSVQLFGAQQERALHAATSIRSHIMDLKIKHPVECRAPLPTWDVAQYLHTNTRSFTQVLCLGTRSRSRIIGRNLHVFYQPRSQSL